MRKRLGFLFVSSFALSILIMHIAVSFAAQPADSQTPPHIDDEVIVRFRAGRDEYSKLMIHYGVGTKRARVFRNLEGLELVKLPRGLSVQDAIAFYQRYPDVLYAEPNYILHTTNIPTTPALTNCGVSTIQVNPAARRTRTSMRPRHGISQPEAATWLSRFSIQESITTIRS